MADTYIIIDDEGVAWGPFLGIDAPANYKALLLKNRTDINPDDIVVMTLTEPEYG